jgi:hypothetical protein
MVEWADGDFSMVWADGDFSMVWAFGDTHGGGSAAP